LNDPRYVDFYDGVLSFARLFVTSLFYSNSITISIAALSSWYLTTLKTLVMAR
jgi:hypothetical protein